ncbi:MAG TPA: RidA family protein [Solirubrobacteraceae bacterium]|jgi:enamine deaminase RidA (YjgF/YER057c/UK114 family)
MDLRSPPGHPAPAGYHHVAIVPAGRQVWTAGQLPTDGDGAVASSWDAQARQVFANVGEALAAGGASWSDVFRIAIYMTDLDGLGAVREARDSVIDSSRPPISTLVVVAGLVHPQARVEVEAVAALPPD